MKRKNICGDKIRQLRETTNTSQEALVSLMNSFGTQLTVTDLNNIETYKRKLYDVEIVSICKIFKITADALLKK